MKNKRPVIIAGVLLMLYIIFIVWYGGNSKPMTPQEVDAMIAKIQKSAGKEGQPEAPVLKIFREIAKSDDGKEYYMVNLIKFRKKALYPEGLPYSDDPREADHRYAMMLIPYLLKHGGHPVYGSDVMGRFIHPEGADDWDQCSVVRYRSRRDMMAMAADIAGKNIDVHKWAALEKTQVFPVKPFFSLFMVRSMMAGVFIIFGVLLNSLLRIVKKKGSIK